MKRLYKLMLILGGALLLLFDARAVLARVAGTAGDEVDWLKVAFALTWQAIAVVGAVLYAAFLSRSRPMDTRPNVVLDALRLRLVPVFAVVLMAAFSVNVLYNAVNCGSQPIPTSRGNSKCPNER